MPTTLAAAVNKFEGAHALLLQSFTDTLLPPLAVARVRCGIYTNTHREKKVREW